MPQIQTRETSNDCLYDHFATIKIKNMFQMGWKSIKPIIVSNHSGCLYILYSDLPDEGLGGRSRSYEKD